MNVLAGEEGSDKVLVKLVRDIYPGIDAYTAIQGTPRANSFH